MDYEQFAQLCEKARDEAKQRGDSSKQAMWAVFLKHISEFPTDKARMSMFLGMLEGLLENMFDDFRPDDVVEAELIKIKMRAFMSKTLNYTTLFED